MTIGTLPSGVVSFAGETLIYDVSQPGVLQIKTLGRPLPEVTAALLRAIADDIAHQIAKKAETA